MGGVKGTGGRMNDKRVGGREEGKKEEERKEGVSKQIRNNKVQEVMTNYNCPSYFPVYLLSFSKLFANKGRQRNHIYLHKHHYSLCVSCKNIKHVT